MRQRQQLVFKKGKITVFANRVWLIWRERYLAYKLLLTLSTVGHCLASYTLYPPSMVSNTLTTDKCFIKPHIKTVALLVLYEDAFNVVFQGRWVRSNCSLANVSHISPLHFHWWFLRRGGLSESFAPEVTKWSIVAHKNICTLGTTIHQIGLN